MLLRTCHPVPQYAELPLPARPVRETTHRTVEDVLRTAGSQSYRLSRYLGRVLSEPKVDDVVFYAIDYISVEHDVAISTVEMSVHVLWYWFQLKVLNTPNLYGEDCP